MFLPESSSSSFLSLPEFIFFEIILNTFLSVKELSALDVAINNHATREAFHSSLVENNYSFDMTENQKKSGIETNFLNFVFKRNILIPKAFIKEVGGDLAVCNKTYNCLISIELDVRLSDKSLSLFFKCCGASIKSILMTKMESASGASMQAIAKYCKEVRVLDLTSCSLVRDSGILALTSQCTSLEHLNTSGCGLLRQDSCMYIASNLVGLVFLDLRFNSRVNDEFLQLLGKKCRKLKFLKLCNTKRTTDFEVTNAGIIGLSGLSELVSLDISRVRLVTSAALSLGLTHWPNLRHLSLESCPYVDDDVLLAMSNNLCLLESLDISWCRRCTDTGVAVVVSALSRTLENVNLNGLSYCAGDTFRAIATCYNLTSICLQHNTNMTTEMIKLIVKNRGKSQGSALKALHLRQCYSIDEAAIIAIADNCPELILLDIGGLRHVVTLAALTHLASSACVREGCLRSLGIAECGASEYMQPLAEIKGRGVSVVLKIGADKLAADILASFVRVQAEYSRQSAQEFSGPRHTTTPRPANCDDRGNIKGVKRSLIADLDIEGMLTLPSV